MNKKLSLAICIIAFAIVLSLTACTHNTTPQPTTTEQVEASSENIEATTTGTDAPTFNAKELFERAAKEIIKLATVNPTEIVKEVFGDNVEIIYKSVKIGGQEYLETSAAYEELKNYYSDIFIGDALDWVLSTKFINIDGVLYCLSSGGAAEWSLMDTEVILISQVDERYVYEVILNEVDVNGTRGLTTKSFTVEKIDNTYKISEIDYVPYLLDNKEASSENTESTSNETDALTVIAKELFERAAREIIMLSTENPSTIVRRYLGDNVKIIYKFVEIGGKDYFKTSASYDELKNYYSDIFMGDELDRILSIKFINVDGVLYCSPEGGAFRWLITDTQVSLISQVDERYVYKATFKEVDSGGTRDTMTKSFTVEKIDNKYRISEIDYLPDNKEASSETAEGTSTGASAPAFNAKELFERAAKKIIQLAAENPTDIVRLVFGSNADIIDEFVNIGGEVYYKTSASYEELKNYYSDIFMGDALDWLLSTKFINVDDVLYCSPSGGATGWSITDTEVKLISQVDERYVYEATFKEVDDNETREAMTKRFIVEKIDNTYKISEIDYVPYLLTIRTKAR